MSDSLQAFANRQLAGDIFREDKHYVFRYAPQATPEQFISLTMPVRTRDYEHTRLHPIFEMHLPEGYLLAVIKRHFAKLVPTDDLGLLSLLSASIRGRLQYKSETSTLPPLALEALLHPASQTLFNELVERFALHSPLSGVQPKVLAQVLNKATLKLDDYIIKAWGPEYPQLALNEYWCMKACQNAGITVPEFHLSDDGALFIMKRFDISADGTTLGFEDMCVLQARQRDDKYVGSYEQLAKTITLFVSPELKASSLQQFFKMMVLNQRLQNGDAHLKNFGVVYENINHIRLAPAYDVVSTTAYLRNDQSALTMMGSRKWWPRKDLIRFGINACGLTNKQAEALYDESIKALVVTAQDIERSINHTKADDQQKLLTHLLRLMTEY